MNPLDDPRYLAHGDPRKGEPMRRVWVYRRKGAKKYGVCWIDERGRQHEEAVSANKREAHAYKRRLWRALNGFAPSQPSCRGWR